jgi:hypothetical protein
MYCSGSPRPQGSPRYWKYYWRVFSIQSAWEDDEFFKYAPVLCNADFVKEVERVHALGQWCMVYGFRLPRADPANPWDMSSPKWEGVEFACRYDDDPDIDVWDGHK